jgi:hypothetical protein
MPTVSVADLLSLTSQSVPWAIPVIMASVIVAVVVGVLLWRRLGWASWVLAGAIVSLGIIVGVTLTPNANFDGKTFTDPRPDPGPWGYLTAPQYWFHLDERSLNVALFIPLGLTLALLVRGRLHWIVLAVGLALPWIVEVLQIALPFSRDSQYIDIADNSTGFVVGFLIGFGLGLIASYSRERVSASG